MPAAVLPAGRLPTAADDVNESNEWAFRPGLELSAALYEQAVQPLMERHYPALSYGFARLSHGSAVLGFDTAESMDHGWGPRGTLFLSPSDMSELAPRLDQLFAREFPRTVLGVPTHLDDPDLERARPRPSTAGPIRHGVRFATPADFFRTHLGFDPCGEMSLVDWLSVSSQRLRTIACGRVFHDSDGSLDARRGAVHWYPDDVWAYLMASQWRRIGQEEPFVGRAGAVGDQLGAGILATRLCREIMRLAFLQARTHAPYSKWFGSAFALLSCAETLTPILTRAGSAADSGEREEHLTRAYRIAADLHNDLGIGAPESTEIRSYHDRPYRVIGADRFAEALEATIASSRCGMLPRGLGAIWQLTDSTGLLEDVPACRAVYSALVQPP